MPVDQSGGLVRLSEAGGQADVADDVRGMVVRDRNGREIGTVDDLLVDTGERRVRFLRIEHGGIFGATAEPSYVPVDTVVRIDVEVHINRSRLQIADAPVPDPRRTDQSEYFRDLYGHYGCLPFWAPGYRYPRIRRAAKWRI